MGLQDRTEMNDIAANEAYGCPHPVLFVVGHHEPNEYAVRAYLFHRDQTYEELARVVPGDDPVDDTTAQRASTVFPNSTDSDDQ